MLSDSETQVGLLKTTLLDYPGRVASMVFFQGCNMHCPFCHNPGFVDSSQKPSDLVSLQEVYNHLVARKKVLSGFVISGGEALLSKELPELISYAKKLGYKVKLDTNGMLPEKLYQLLSYEETRPDFVAVDVKTSLHKYSFLTKIIDAGFRLQKTIEILTEDNFNNVLKNFQNIQVEYRTVLVPNLVTLQDIEAISALLPQNASWKLTQFRPGNCLDSKMNNLAPYSQEQAKSFLNYAQKFVPTASFR